MSSLHKLVSLNNCGVCGFFGSVKGVSSGTADEVLDGAFGDSKDTVDGYRSVFDKVTGGGFSVSTKLSICSHT